MVENANQGEYVGEEYFEDKQKSGFRGKIEKFLDSRYFIVLCFLFISIASFLFGRLSVLDEKKEPIKIINDSTYSAYSDKVENKKTSLEQTASVGVVSTESVVKESGEVIGSKNSNKYHYPWCAGAKNIGDQNKIVFNSIAEARAKGYLPASNCKGLK